MRFEKIHLHAFGPFTDVELSFPQNGPDLHVIFGRNEAGKSSLLRALRDLLFGIPARSGDNFIHDNPKLRIEAHIRNQAGRGLRFLRRKGNAKTLMDANGVALSDDVLHPFLGGVTADYFSTMFGMGGTELRAGSEHLLSGSGDLGNALFSASHGGTPVRAVIEQLEKDAGSLFRGRATKDILIRNGAANFKELLRKSKDAIVSVEAWDAVQADLSEAYSKREELIKAHSECVEKLAWIQRCEDSLPSVGQLWEAKRELEALGEMPGLPQAFASEATQALSVLEAAAKQPEILAKKIHGLSQELSNCAVDELLLSAGPEIKALHEELAGYRVKRESLGALETKNDALKTKLVANMRLMKLPNDFSSLERLRIGEAQHTACEAAAKSVEETALALSLHRREVETMEGEIKANEDKLADLPETDLEVLRDALADAAEATEAAKTLDRARSEADSLKHTAQGTRALLPGAPEALGLDALAALALPGTNQIHSFEEQFAEAARLAAEKKSLIKKQNQEIRSYQGALRALEHFGALPSEETLQEARQHRDRGWAMVLAEWKGEGAEGTFVEGMPLERAFPQALAQADEIADRLRKDASAVAEAQEITRQIKACEDQIQEAQKELEAAEETTARLKKEWEALWAPLGIKQGTPAQMREWREGWLELRRAVANLHEATKRLGERETKVDSARKTLAAALGDSVAKSFEALFKAAKQRVQQGEETQGARKQINKSLNDQRVKLRLKRDQTGPLQNEATRAESEWKRHASELGIPETTSPALGRSLLQERRDLVNLFDRWTIETAEATGLKDALTKYENQVHALAVQFKVTATEAPARIGQLWAISSANHDAFRDRERLKKEHSQLETELSGAKSESEQAAQGVEKLLRTAGLQTTEQLRDLIHRLERQTALNSDLGKIRTTLAGLTRNEPLEEFVAHVGQEAPETFSQRKESLRLQKEDFDRQLDELSKKIHGLKDQSAAMEKAQDQAADFKQQAENQASALREQAARYIRLQLSLDVLRKQVDRFREENQGPLLEKSSAVFRQMTQGAFTSLAADFNEKDLPILVGCRANGSRVPIEGMSEGTRDQLYLALRFAALDLHLQTHEPMPLILDDLLMTFDNQRTKAVLPELAKMAGRTQVFLFTHHEHLIDLCKEALGTDGFALHRLGAN